MPHIMQQNQQHDTPAPLHPYSCVCREYGGMVSNTRNGYSNRSESSKLRDRSLMFRGIGVQGCTGGKPLETHDSAWHPSGHRGARGATPAPAPPDGEPAEVAERAARYLAFASDAFAALQGAERDPCGAGEAAARWLAPTRQSIPQAEMVAGLLAAARTAAERASCRAAPTTGRGARTLLRAPWRGPGPSHAAPAVPYRDRYQRAVPRLDHWHPAGAEARP